MSAELSAWIGSILQMASVKAPFLVAIFAIMGVARSIFKPLMIFIHGIIEATPSNKDNLAIAKFEKGKFFKAIVWLMDYVFSIKIKK